MHTSKKPQANQTSVPEKLNARQQAAAELLLKRGWVDAPPKAGAGHAVPWDTVRTKEELLAALPPLPAYEPPGNDDAPAESLAHNPIPASDRRGAFVEQGNSGRSRVTRSGHKP